VGEGDVYFSSLINKSSIKTNPYIEVIRVSVLFAVDLSIFFSLSFAFSPAFAKITQESPI